MSRLDILATHPSDLSNGLEALALRVAAVASRVVAKRTQIQEAMVAQVLQVEATEVPVVWAAILAVTERKVAAKEEAGEGPLVELQAGQRVGSAVALQRGQFDARQK